MYKPIKGFTLVELLVVIAIIALLLSILMPTLGRAREQARMVICKVNLRSVGTSLYLYAQDNMDRVVPACAMTYQSYDATFELFLDKYLGQLYPAIPNPYKGFAKPAKSSGLWACPSDKEKRYGSPTGTYGRWPALKRSYTMNFMVSTYYSPTEGPTGFFGFSAKISRLPSSIAVFGEHWDEYNIHRANVRSANFFYKLYPTCPSIYAMEWIYTHPNKKLNFVCADTSVKSYFYWDVSTNPSLGGDKAYWNTEPAR